MKILFVTTISNTVNAFLIPHIKMLIEQGHNVDVAFNPVQEPDPDLIRLGCKIHEIPFQRSPMDLSNQVAYKKLKNIILSEKYDLVHTHTPVASACVRLACRKEKNVKVFYTAHGFHFYKGAPLINWLLYYPVERWLAKYTHVLITINKEDYHRAKKRFNSKRVEYIPGIGLDTLKYSNQKVDKVLKRAELGIPENSFVVLSVGELNKNKNHEIILKAIAKLKRKDIYYVICGQGELENYLIDLSRKLGIHNQFKLLGYRNDVSEICKISDVFAFPSKREGLGLAALEAMASGLPIVTSNVHGIVDYSIDGVTGYTSHPTDADGFADAIDRLYQSEKLRMKYGGQNIQAVNRFDIKNVICEMKRIYFSE